MRISTKVTGILVTGKTIDRYPLAKRAVDAWLSQLSTQRHELLVINDHPNTPLFATPPDGVREIWVPQRMTLGELRNIGIDNATSEYLVQWDDDDVSHNTRLPWQLENTRLGRASILRYEIHADLQGDAFVNDGHSIRCRGFPGTMLWPRNVACRFPAKGKAEDTEFVLALQQACGVDVLNNDPQLYCRFYHGMNTWHREHIMKRKPGSIALSPSEQSYVQQLVQRMQTRLETGRVTTG